MGPRSISISNSEETAQGNTKSAFDFRALVAALRGSKITGKSMGKFGEPGLRLLKQRKQVKPLWRQDTKMEQNSTESTIPDRC